MDQLTVDAQAGRGHDTCHGDGLRLGHFLYIDLDAENLEPFRKITRSIFEPSRDRARAIAQTTDHTISCKLRKLAKLTPNHRSPVEEGLPQAPQILGEEKCDHRAKLFDGITLSGRLL